jgi:hypothetical protein
MFWLPDEPDDRIGECRRNPPSIYPGETQNHEEHLDILEPEGIMTRTFFPVTSHAIWCGEFKSSQ